MTVAVENRMLKRSLLRIIFLVTPAVILSGYITYVIKNALVARGTQVDPLAYEIILVVVVSLAASLTAKPLIEELRKRKRENQARIGRK